MLPPLPIDFVRSRDGLHALAFYVISPARRRRTGRIGLHWLPGGFGTPSSFDDDLFQLFQDMPPLDYPLGVTAEAVAVLDAWFLLGSIVLEQLRVGTHHGDPSSVHLWPKHFDLALELGDERTTPHSAVRIFATRNYVPAPTPRRTSPVSSATG